MILHETFPDIQQMEPLTKDTMEMKDIPLIDKVSLFSTLDTISQSVKMKYPETMEMLGQNTGYILYRTSIKKMQNI